MHRSIRYYPLGSHHTSAAAPAVFRLKHPCFLDLDQSLLTAVRAALWPLTRVNFFRGERV
ncbi:hypothetical protein EGJ28_06985 [Stutzerimonas xanthomarina]|uniref:Uncharacterized protein n=1 Tax=Stutzerimonas xanthomarina TaxID=271420 RepID=A0A427E9T1_9GAMM|nr:hypothetical protein CXK98_08930 [Stutzerimonas kunmingensis]RRU74559.1 hypothetical protein EGJ05_06890 [Stutzerimonas xanthomarina]RRV13356.1 hypothetical protein EGJ28_06985 [Stutzerimonas xanthomarina]